MMHDLMARCLVTGGAGFIGSHLTKALVQRGDEVTVLDNLFSGKREHLQEVLTHKNFCFIEGDITNSKTVQEAVQGMDIVFHQAALGSVPRSVKDPMGTHEVNVNGTLELLIAARKANVKRVVNAASSSAYGDTPELPKRETMPANPFSPYAVSKLAQEQYCRAFAVSYGMKTVSLRYFNVFGAHQDPYSQYAAVIPKFFQAFLRKESPMIYGDGEQTRDFTYVGDVVHANLKASELSQAEGQVFNIGGGNRVSINKLAEMIAKLLNTDVKSKHTDPRPGDIRHSLADITFAQKMLNWEPKTSLEEGLRLALPWYKEHLSG